jgi:hypothetical protein
MAATSYAHNCPTHGKISINQNSTNQNLALHFTSLKEGRSEGEEKNRGRRWE